MDLGEQASYRFVVANMNKKQRKEELKKLQKQLEILN